MSDNTDTTPAEDAPVGEPESKQSEDNVDAGADEEEEPADSPKRLGNEHFAAGRYEDAVREYTRGLQQRPHHVLFSNRSAALLKLGQKGAAMQDADRAAQMKPDWPKAHFRRGAALEAMGATFDAMCAYEIAGEEEPHRRTGRVLLRKVDPRSDGVCEWCLSKKEQMMECTCCGSVVYCDQACKEAHAAQHAQDKTAPWGEQQVKQAAAQAQQVLGRALGARDGPAVDMALRVFRRVQRYFAANREMPTLAKGLGIMGSGFQMRPQGEPAQNHARAAEHFEAGLAVFTRKFAPAEWGKMHISLAGLFQIAKHGQKPENQDRAIAHFKTAMAVFTKEQATPQWHSIQLSLGNEFRGRIKGSKRENQNRALAHYHAALSVLSKEKAPDKWARLAGTIATAFMHRIDGHKPANQDMARQRFEEALAALSKDDHPQLWSRTHALLAELFQQHQGPDKDGNRAKAIEHFTTSLELITEQDAPDLWARIQRGLGELKTTTDHQGALAHFKEAARVLTHADMPRDWARLQHDLGDLFGQMEEDVEDDADAGDDDDFAAGLANEDRAVACYKHALTVRTSAVMPVDHARSAMALARQLLRNQEEGRAAPYIESALSSAQAVRAVDESGEAPKRFKEDEIDDLMGIAIDVAMEQEEHTRALELIETAQVGTLRDAMGWWYCMPHNVSQRQALAQLRAGRAAVFPELRVADAPGNDQGWQRTIARYRQLEQFVKEAIAPMDDIYAAVFNEPLDAAAMAALTESQNTALAVTWWAADSLRVLVLQPGQAEPDVFTLAESKEEVDAIEAAIDEIGPAAAEGALRPVMERVSALLRADEWLDGVDAAVDKLLVIPHGHLARVPLHALAQPGHGTVAHRFVGGVTVSPSVRLAADARARPAVDTSADAGGRRLVAVVAAEEDAADVAAALGGGEQGDTLVVGDDATRMKATQAWRTGAPTAILFTHLADADKGPITCRDILATTRVPRCELALLGATTPDVACGLVFTGARSAVYRMWTQGQAVGAQVAAAVAAGTATAQAVRDAMVAIAGDAGDGENYAYAAGMTDPAEWAGSVVVA